MRERRTHGSVRGLRREPLVYSTELIFSSRGFCRVKFSTCKEMIYKVDCDKIYMIDEEGFFKGYLQNCALQ